MWAGALRPSGGGATVVVMTRRHLNDQQWFVLSWVADGCPDGVFDEDDHGHKISARALSNRGLITVRRRNGKWSAKLTDTDRFYLENQRFPVPADADPVAQYAAIRPERQEKVDTRKAAPPRPKPKAPTESLVASVMAAGGVLFGKDLANYTDVDQLVLAANRFRKTPAGTRLDSFYVRDRGTCVSLVELRGWEPSWEKPLAVPERVGRFHPAVRELRDRGLSEIARGTWTRRVLLMLNSLARAAEARGYTVRAVPVDTGRYRTWTDRQPRGDLLIETPNVRRGLRTHHVLEQVPAPEGSWNRVDVVATDRIRLTLTTTHGRDRTWSDTSKRRVEDKLHEPLLHFAIADAKALVRAQIQREEELIRERRAAEEAERKRREEEDRQRREGLNDEVARWRQAQDIRGYCRALAMNRSGAEVTAHVEWALEYADSIDPLSP